MDGSNATGLKKIGGGTSELTWKGIALKATNAIAHAGPWWEGDGCR